MGVKNWCKKIVAKTCCKKIGVNNWYKNWCKNGCKKIGVKRLV